MITPTDDNENEIELPVVEEVTPADIEDDEEVTEEDEDVFDDEDDDDDEEDEDEAEEILEEEVERYIPPDKDEAI